MNSSNRDDSDGVRRTFSELGSFVTTAMVALVLCTWIREMDAIGASVLDGYGIYPPHVTIARVIMSTGVGACVGMMVLTFLGWIVRLDDKVGDDREDYKDE